MSAWIVSKQHIDVLTKALFDYGLIGDEPPTVVGKMLWDENLESIHYRYPDTEESHRSYPGPLTFRGPTTVARYRYRDRGDRVRTQVWNREKGGYAQHTVKLTPTVLLKAAECYDYQTCEHPEYANSRTRALIQALCEKLTADGARSDGPEASAAPWGL